MSGKTGLVIVGLLIVIGLAVGGLVIFSMQTNQSVSLIAKTSDAQQNSVLATEYAKAHPTPP